MTESRRGSLLVIFLTVFIDLLGFGMVLPLLPAYAQDFGAGLSKEQQGWLIGLLMASFSAMQFLFSPAWGKLSDRIGRRPVLMIGLAGSMIFYTLFGIASVYKSLLWLFVARIGAGISGATISTAQAYIADTTTLESRTKGMALIGAAFGLGFTFGPLFGYLALMDDPTHPGPGPGYAAAALSAAALLLAFFKLPESLTVRGEHAERKSFGLASVGDALATPSIGMLLVATFVCVCGFATFESTLSLFLKAADGPFQFDYGDMLLIFAFVGLMLTVIQGGLVRRLAGKVPDVALASSGAVIEIIGFMLLARAPQVGTLGFLLVALGVVVTGFAFITPALNSMISRRSDPAKQGRILGVAQSVSSLARIFGPVIGARLFYLGSTYQFWVAAALMVLGLAMVLVAARSGHDYQAAAAEVP